MAQIIGLGFQAREKWADDIDNIFKTKDPKIVDKYTKEPVYRTSKEYVDLGYGSFEDFWKLRQAKLDKNVEEIFTQNMRKGGFPFNKFTDIFANSTDSAIQQVIHAMPSWDRYMDMVNSQKGGTIYGIDIETFGDIQKSKGVFGITEIAVNEGFISSMGYKNKSVSIAIGIDKDQREYLMDLVNKFESNGWNSLDEMEQVSLQRMGKYGGKITERFAEGNAKNTPINGKWYTTVRSLLSDSMDPQRMREGIENLHKVYRDYKNSRSSEVLSSVMEFLDRKQDSLFYAANSKFDLNGLRNMARKVGATYHQDVIDKIRDNALDVTYMVRAAAAADEQSVSSWGESVYGRGGGADMENLLHMFRINGQQEHLGASDLENEIGVLYREHPIIYDTYRDAIAGMQGRTIDPEHTLYYIKRGVFEKQDADDFAYIPNANGTSKAAANYSITQEFWRIDTQKSGVISVDGEDKFRLVMTNEADALSGQTPASIVLTGNTAEDVKSRLDYMADVFDDSIMPKEFIQAQQEYHYTDLGRREFEKFLNPTDTRIEKKGQQTIDYYGYAGIKKAYEINDIISNWEKTNGEITGIDSSAYRKAWQVAEEFANNFADQALEREVQNGVLGKKKIADIQPGDITYETVKRREQLFKQAMVFNGDYDAQAFIGMRGILKDRKPLFDYIMNTMDSNARVQKMNNIDKTIVFRNAYESAMEAIIDGRDIKGADIPLTKIHFQDMYGIDVLRDPGKGLYSRIDAYDHKSITSGLSSIYRKMSLNDIKASLTNLSDRDLLSISFVDDIMKQLSEADVSTEKSFSSAVYFASQDIAYKLDRGSMIDNSDMFKDGPSYRATRNSFTGRAKEFTNFRIDLGNDITMPFNEVMMQKRVEAERAVNSAIINGPTTMYSANKRISDTQIDTLLSSLGLDTDDAGYIKERKKLFNNMFNEGKKYSIGERKDLTTFIVNNDNSSSFVFITRDEDAQRLYEKLTSGDYDFGSYKRLRNSIEESGGYLGTMFELQKINRYDIGGQELLTVNQGEVSEKFLIPSFNIATRENGTIDAYYNSPDRDVYALWAKGGERILDSTQSGEYQKATASGRRLFNQLTKDLPSSPSYRRVGTERIMTLGPSDYIHASEMRLESVKDLFKYMVNMDTGNSFNNLNIAQQIVYKLGETERLNDWMIPLIKQRATDRNGNLYTVNRFLSSVMDTDVYDQFISSRMTIGKLSTIPGFQGSSLAAINDPILEIIRREVMDNPDAYGFNETVQDAFSRIPHASELSPVGTESAVHKGSYFTTMPGEYKQWAGMYSTMRPTYTQQNNAISFALDDMKNAVKDGKFYGLKNNAVVFGVNSLEVKEFAARVSLASNGQGAYENNFIGRVKFMSEYELQKTLNDMGMAGKGKSVRESVMKQFGISEEQYRAMYDIFQSDMFSMHEDNALIAPGLKETPLFQSRESMKMTMDVSSMDRKATMEFINKYAQSGSTIDHNSVLYVTRKNRPVFYNGPEATISEDAAAIISDAFDAYARGEDNGIVDFYIDLTKGSIVDDKMMFNGAEKATVHTINVQNMAKVGGITESDALKIANTWFSEVGDGAVTIMNPKSAKHGGLHSFSSDWDTIVKNYALANKTNVLAGYLNKFAKKNKDISKGIGMFSSFGNRLVGTTALADTGALFIEELMEDIKADKVGLDSKVNKAIIAEIEEMQRLNQQNAIMQRQNMTEFLGKKYRMDQRTDQAFRMRGMKYSFDGGDGITDIASAIADDMRTYSKNYNAEGDFLESLGYGALQNYANEYSKARNVDKIALARRRDDAERSIKGLIETVRSYYKEPVTSQNIAGRNIVQFDINEMLKTTFYNQGGVSTEDLRSSLFFVDGKPSKLLQQKAKEQNVNIDRNSYSIFIKMNTDVTLANGKTSDGILVPVQNVSSMIGSDEHFFQNQQRHTTRMFNKILDGIRNPKDVKNLGELISNEYKDYIENYMEKELNYMKKDADITKFIQQYDVPTSQYLLGQDEAAPLLKSQMTKKFNDAWEAKNKAERALLEDGAAYDVDKIIEYGQALDTFDEMIEDLAEGIRTGEKNFSQYVALSTRHNKVMSNALKVRDANGRLHHGMGAVTSREALENAGIDFFNVSMELVADMEQMDIDPKYKGRFENIAKFKKEHSQQITELKRNLNGVEISLKDGNGFILNIDESKPLMRQLNDQFMTNGISVKNINEAIIRGEHKIGKKNIVDLFDTSRIAQDYLSEVGTFGAFVRSPVFVGQPVFKVFLDENMRGNQFRSLDPTLSLINNLDFDGDNLAVIMRLNGSGLLRIDDEVFKNYKATWKDFAINNSDNLLAGLIEDASVFREEHATSHRIQQAMLLKIEDEETYKKGIQAFLDNHDIEINGKLIETLADMEDSGYGKAIEYAAGNSYEMADVFNNSSVANTLKSEKMSLAAYAVRKRKDYIGSVSTPAYRIRASLLDTMDNPNITAEQRSFLNDIFVNFDNMLTEQGGFMNISEQKGIDTKFARDAIKYSKLSQWENAMSDIIRNPQSNRVAEDVVKMFEAIGPNVYGITTQAEFKQYADVVLGTPTASFKEAFLKLRSEPDAEIILQGMTFKHSQKDLDKLTQLWSVSDFIRATNEIPELSKAFNEKYSGVNYRDFLINAENTTDAAKQQVRNTPAKNVMDIAELAKSGFNSPYKPNNVYFRTSSIMNDRGTEFFVHEGGNMFREIYMGKSDKRIYEISPAGNSPVYFSNNMFKGQKGYDFGLIRHGMGNSWNEMQDAVMQERIAKTLDALAFRTDKKGKVIGTRDLSDKRFRVKSFDRLFNDRFDDNVARKIYAPDAQTGRDTIEWLHHMFKDYRNENIDEFIEVFDRAKIMGLDSDYGSGIDMIRAMNRQIAEEGWKDVSGLGKPASDYYDVLMRGHVMDVFGGSDNYDKYLDFTYNMPNFDDQKYTEALDSLNGRLYDIDEVGEEVGKGFDRVSEEIKAFNGQVPDEALQRYRDYVSGGRESHISSRINDLMQSNADIVSEAQKDIYDMFENNQQLAKNFGLDGSVDDREHMVAFGEFMGQKFKNLSQSDIDRIMSADFDAYAEGLDAIGRNKLKFAMQQTQASLENFTPTTASDSAIKWLKSSDGTAKSIIEQMNGQLKKMFEEETPKLTELQNAAKSGAEQATENAAEGAGKAAAAAGAETASKTTRKTITGSAFTAAKETFEGFGITKKTVGIAAGALAALGILNNVIHRERPQSPLEPARTSNNNNDPNYNNTKTQHPHAAPPSPKTTRTVYHDRQSGLNFKVSAQTKNNIDARNNAKLIGMAGGGEPSIHSYADMSGVTNNWLQNKFAELAN